MGKRSGLFFAILLIASMAQVKMRGAAAQSTSSDTFACPSGVIPPSMEVALVRRRIFASRLVSRLTPSGAYGGEGVSSRPLASNIRVFKPRASIAGFPNSPISAAGHVPPPTRSAARGSAAGAPARSPSDGIPADGSPSLGRLLPVYGDSLFPSSTSTFAPIRKANVTPDYVLGPGNKLVIRIRGQVNFNAQVTVDRSGAMYLPRSAKFT